MGPGADDRGGPTEGGPVPVAVVAVRSPLVLSAVETVTGVLEDAGSRGSAAWAALRAPGAELVPARRWPWALGAAVAGAAAGAVVALAIGRVRTSDGADALEPEDVRAVVDRTEGGPPP